MTKLHFLDFESDLADIASEIEKITDAETFDAKKEKELSNLEKKFAKKTAEIYKDLTAWQVTQVARHPERPYLKDYIDTVFDDFVELHGDRHFADDASIIGGLARLGGYSVMLIGQQKGRGTREKTRCNFGMTQPEGYRKALRLMKLAEKFALPVLTFIDTPGAFPGIDAEERNQAEAIGQNILELSQLKVPVIATIIGEGGSGGALALGVADSTMMLQYAIYSVISPEGCASILWKDAGKADEAAKALSMTSSKLLDLGLVDKIIPEPIGGAHRDSKLMSVNLRNALLDQLRALTPVPIDVLLKHRSEKLLSFGQFTRLKSAPTAQSLTPKVKTAKKTTKKVKAIEVSDGKKVK